MTAEQEYRLSVAAELKQVETACRFVAHIAGKMGLSDEVVHKCHLAVEEICTNIIEHGYEFRQNEVIELTCTVLPDRLRVTIVDSAAPFNPLEHADPDPASSLFDRYGGGWGIFFVKKFMDKVYYTYVHNRNHLTIEKLLG